MADPPPLPSPPPPPPPVLHLRLELTGDEARPLAVVLQLAADERVRLQLDIQDDGSVAATLEPARTGTAEMSPAGVKAEEAGSSADSAAPEPQAPTLEQQHADLLHENGRLQGRVRQYLDGITKASRKTLQHASGQLMEGAEQRYLLALQQLRLLRGEQASAAVAAEAALAPERARLAAAAAKTQAQREALLRFVADAAAASERAAAAGRIKAAVSSAALQRFLAAEPAKGAEVRALRACHARLRRQLEAAERRLKAADQLSAEGLHLVDYEQLRIENASLAAKREARAAEVDKLRGKLAQAVQITAHVREKLHCVGLERGALAARLEAVEGEVQQARAQATAARARRERAQRRRGDLAQDWRVVTDRRCLADMQQQEAELAELQAQAAALRARYEALGSGGGGQSAAGDGR
ncbi:hypothetical protein CHLNCDRAFT_138933 [Chlorella variabilis]|uniref:CCDC113/CCDC96 coiled-coil domain-containing protein n=1 Tax=Chlorella variabilis TaxID=554065 RepID=E1ZNZ4_CHLVA|nr:hypothetical protein CHLNCDRAFT_138933 [Chlorella variabilis]EFN52426.1 hypothetical protein CHLNCDRAFT_138933 [Chlorella variabilis]|eukprot:XP_005844528.1 hypothetical protein CHLNCDRAFT_138933 [Chlorella variabilis]